MKPMEVYDGLSDEFIIPRHQLFVLYDGTFVVQWSENRVQELENGNYRAYSRQDYGTPITDYELNQLKAVGLVEHFDGDNVWLCPLPERDDFNWLTAWEQKRSRSYYLNTTLPGLLLQDVIDLLDDLGLADNFQARVRDDFVVLWGSKGISFHKFDDVEKARNQLATKAPEAFKNTVVAFIETTRRG
jgi:hypothetical protein